MGFARKIWHLLVAIKDGLVLLLLLMFFAALYAVLSFRPMPESVRPGALLVALDGVVVEEPAEIDPFSMLVSARAPIREHRARDVIRAIDGAARDDRIKAVVLDLDYFLGGGQVHLSEIGAAGDRVRKAGKPVLAHALLYTDDSMQIAAHADEVWVDPMGGALIAGPGGSQPYFAGLLDRLKVNVHVYRVGTYKSAVEPFTRSNQSAEAKEALRAVLGAMWQNWQDEVARVRPDADVATFSQKPADALRAVGDPAQAALDAKLVDHLGSREDFGARVAEIVGPDPDERELPGSYAKTHYDSWIAATPMRSSGAPIGVITVAGEIQDGETGPGTAGGETIARRLDEALDDDLAALVVRIDSPGGSALASERIRQAILRHHERGVPVVVSMANLAASGGYWVATAGDTIFAEPSTITGSIGVFGILPSFEGTLAQWCVNADGVRTTPLSGQPDLLGGTTPEFDAVLQHQVEGIYGKFLSIVAKSRKMPVDRVAPIAEGRIWDGGTARQLGLVDRFGNLDDAVRFAAKEAKLTDGDWHVRYLDAKPDVLTRILQDMTAQQPEDEAPADAFALAAIGRQMAFERALADLDLVMGGAGIQARCLDCPTGTARVPAKSGAGWRKAVSRAVPWF